MTKTLTAAVAVGAIISTFGCSDDMLRVKAAAAAETPQRVERGEYLVKIMACSDCHTPMKMGPAGPEHDATRFLSGHPEQVGALPPAKLEGPWMMAGAATNTAFSGPWGVSYAANLTPDQNTGLGIWTEEMFVRAIRLGRHMGTSREILPPMPWPAFRHATDEDLASIYAYLRTLKPVVNHVPDIQPAEPIF
jgi:mono/diheme cytochrome c family protein